MGVRIDQHGLCPERLWGLAAIVVAVGYGVAYFADSVRGWTRGWAERLRDPNLKLAAGTAVYALLLALPILNFGAISTNSQLARLENGSVPVAEFDFDALRWDFGAPGRAALARLAKAGGDTGRLAIEARDRLDTVPFEHRARPGDSFRVTISPDTPDRRKLVLDYLEGNPFVCPDICQFVELYQWEDGLRQFAIMTPDITGFRPVNLPQKLADQQVEQEEDRPPALKVGSQVEIRRFTGRRLYVDGKPVGEPFE